MSGLYNLVTAQSHRLTHGFIEGLKEMQLKREQREREEYLGAGKERANPIKPVRPNESKMHRCSCFIKSNLECV